MVWTLALVVAVGAAVLAAVAEEPSPQAMPPKVLIVPGEPEVDSLPDRSKAQFDTLDDFDTFYFFAFADRQPESGIDFRHRIVDDVGRDYKMVHYDHGNGIVAADVDGSGHHDIYFLTQLGSNYLAKNRGDGTFEDIAARAGVAVADRISVTASFADVDNDGDPDLFVTTVRGGNLLFVNDGNGRFEDVSKAAGVDYVGHSSSAVFFDYNRNGMLDLFLTNVGVYTTEERGRGGYYVGVEGAFSGHLFPERNEPNILYENRGGNRFEPVTDRVGLADDTWAGDASAVDLTGNGYPDLYVLNMQGDDVFYENLQGERFLDRTEDYFPKTPWGTMGIKFFDFDNDGLLDLFLTDMHSDMSETIGAEREKLKSRMQWSDDILQGGDNNIFGNAFYRNLGEGKFVEVSDELGAENYWPWGVSVDDLNASGYDDLFITASMNYPFRYGVNSLLLNNGGERFLDAEFVLGVEPRRDRHGFVDWYEIDCGGEDREHRHCEEEEGRLIVRGVRGSRASVILDIDGDGDLDIVTNELGAEPQVLVSDLSEQEEIRYLKIRLVGSRSNRDGLGARVRVVAGDLVQTKVHDGKSGYLSQSSLPLYFGLGERHEVDRIEVLWPSGIEQVIHEGIPVNDLLEIAEAVPPEPAESAEAEPESVSD